MLVWIQHSERKALDYQEILNVTGECQFSPVYKLSQDGSHSSADGL